MSLLKTIITTKLKYILQKELSQLLPNTQYVLIDGAFKEDLSFKGNYSGATYEEALLALETAFPVGVDQDYAILNPIGLAPINANWTSTGWEADFENKLENIVVDNNSHNIILKLNGSVLTADFDLTNKENTLSTLHSEAYNIHITTWAGTFSEYKLLDDFDKKTLYFISDRANLVFLGNKIINGGTPEPNMFVAGSGYLSPYTNSAVFVRLNKEDLTVDGNPVAQTSNKYNTTGAMTEDYLITFENYDDRIEIRRKTNFSNRLTIQTLSDRYSLPIADYNYYYIADKTTIFKYSYNGALIASINLSELYENRSIVYIKGYKNKLVVALRNYPITSGNFQSTIDSIIMLILDKHNLNIVGESYKFRSFNSLFDSTFGVVDDYIFIIGVTRYTNYNVYYEIIKLDINTLEVIGKSPDWYGSNFGYEDFIKGTTQNELYLVTQSNVRIYDINTLQYLSQYNLGVGYISQFYFDGQYLYTTQQSPNKVVNKYDMVAKSLILSKSVFNGQSFSIISTKYKEETSWLY